MSSVIKKIIYELLTYNEALYSFEAIQWQKAMQEEYDTFVKNHIWNIVYILENQKILKEK